MHFICLIPLLVTMYQSRHDGQPWYQLNLSITWLFFIMVDKLFYSRVISDRREKHMKNILRSSGFKVYTILSKWYSDFNPIKYSLKALINRCRHEEITVDETPDQDVAIDVREDRIVVQLGNYYTLSADHFNIDFKKKDTKKK